MVDTVKRAGRTSAVLLALVLSFAMLGTALADSPPAPPARFVGTVMVNGTPAPAGAAITAVIGSTTCGTTSVFMSGSDARYVLDSPALDPGATPNCGTDGSTVSFTVNGQKANETGVWHSYQLNTVNLTVSAATTTTPAPTTTATVTATPTSGGGNTPVATRTPAGPATGSGTATSSSSSSGWFIIAAALGVVSLGATGLTLARRRNNND
jgi:hypothetical protein